MAPTVLALILGPMMERSLRTSLEISGGKMSIFLKSPIAAGLLAFAAIILITSAIRLLPLGGLKGDDE
jgi:putative tricarboxylic transport membrane protein